MNCIRHAALAAAIATTLSTALPALAAETANEAALRRQIEQQNALLKQQAEQLQALNQRLSALEQAQHQGTPATDAQAGPVSGAAAAAAAVADTRQDDLAALQAQVAQLSGGGSASTRWGRGGEAGPILGSDDGFFTFKPDGRLLLDYSRTAGSDYDARNIVGTQFTSVRLGGEGTIGAFGYHVEADFADNKVALRQAYINYTTRVFGNRTKFYVGNFLKDLGTEGSSESARVPFMLRNAATTVGQPLNSYFGLGAQMYMYGDNWHYSASISGNSPSSSTSGTHSDSITYLTRAHWNPVKGTDGFLHLGAWYYYEKISDGVSSINNTPAIGADYNDNLAVSAGSFANPTHDRGKGFELGGVFRNFWMMNEYGKRVIDSSSMDSVSRHGSSYALGWMITGESPGFSSHSGSWKAVKVNHAVSDGGLGAFELAARYDDYDYTHSSKGGKGDAWTLGFNWYFNDWTRVMLDYVRWKTNNKVGGFTGPDEGNTVSMRAQVVF